VTDGKINIQNVTTSEIKIRHITNKEDANRALQIVHEVFNSGGMK
jgi:aspartate kinase